MLKPLPSNGGYHNINYLNCAVFLSVFIINSVDIILNSKGIVRFLIYSLPFLILFFFSMKSKNNSIDLFVNLIIAVMSIFLTPFGDLTPAVFIFLILHNLSGKRNFYIFGTIIFISLTASAFIQDINPLRMSLYLCGYIYVLLKYYWTIHTDRESRKAENKKLKNHIQIIGTAKHMTDDDILYYYPVMKHHDEEKRYLMINMIRDFANGVSKKALAINYECSEKTIKRYLDKMKDDFSDRLGLKKDDRIFEDQHLTTVCTGMDIIQVIVRQKEY